MTAPGEVFGEYASCYDLLYSDKDYAAEAKFVDGLLRRHAPGARSLLDLGCGTGAHAALLARDGYRVTGVDLSDGMLRRAAERASGLPAEVAERVSFRRDDLRTLRLGATFDAVVSLFHVVSYQTGDDDLRAAFATARAHLRPGGVFLFDFWYGPAVLSQGPSVRVKRLADARLELTRISEPSVHADEHVVAVSYQLFVKEKATGVIADIRETHRVRYLFRPEVDALCAGAGFSVVAAGEWMTEREPGSGSWSVYVIARATG